MTFNTSGTREFLKYLFPILLLAFGGRVVLAVLYPGSLRPDEIFQYLEPAHHLAFGPWVETWEWRAGIRSWLVPAGIAELLRCADVLHVHDMVLFVRVVLAVISLLPVMLFYWAGWRLNRVQGALLCGLVAALWPDMVTAGLRALGECFGGNLYVSGVIIAFLTLRQTGTAHRLQRYILLGGAAFLLGSAGAVRFQFMPAVVMALFYMVIKGDNRDRLAVLIAASIPIIGLGIVDKITLGHYYQSVFKNYYMNINMGIANSFGKKSFIYFIKKYAVFWGALTIPVALLSIRGGRKVAFPLCMAIFIVGYHSLIRHKEVSFVYPAIPLILFSACVGLGEFITEHHIKAKWLFPCLAGGLWLFALSSYQPRWRREAEMAWLQQEASRQQDICGLALNVTDWSTVLGYTGLPHGVGFYFLKTPQEMEQFEGRYNYILTDRTVPPSQSHMTLVDCVHDGYMCLYKVATLCTGEKDYTQFSRALEEENY